MRKLVKIFITVFAFAALLFSTVGPATSATNRGVSHSSSGKSLTKDQKETKKDKKDKKDQKNKKNKKKKSAKKNKTKSGKKTKAAKAAQKKVANFAPTAEPSPTELPACEPELDSNCEPTPIIIIDPTVGPDPEPTCDPTIDKLCRPDLVDPTCDPAVDSWCQIIVDPVPSEPPTGGPDPYPTPEVCWPPTGGPNPYPTPDVCWPPTGGPDPYPTPEVSWPSDAWQTYFDAVAKAQSGYQDYVATAQKGFDIATADAAATRDAEVDSASSFAEVVAAVTKFRLATADEKAKLDQALLDANEALNLLIKKAWDILMASGELIRPIFGIEPWCGVGSDGNPVPVPPIVTAFGQVEHDKIHDQPRR